MSQQTTFLKQRTNSVKPFLLMLAECCQIKQNVIGIMLLLPMLDGFMIHPCIHSFVQEIDPLLLKKEKQYLIL